MEQWRTGVTGPEGSSFAGALGHWGVEWAAGPFDLDFRARVAFVDNKAEIWTSPGAQALGHDNILQSSRN